MSPRKSRVYSKTTLAALARSALDAAAALVLGTTTISGGPLIRSHYDFCVEFAPNGWNWDVFTNVGCYDSSYEGKCGEVFPSLRQQISCRDKRDVVSPPTSILLKPYFGARTLILWLGPFLLLLGGAAAIVLSRRRVAAQPSEAPLSKTEEKKLRDALKTGDDE